MTRFILAREIGQALIGQGLLDPRTSDAALDISVDGVLSLRSVRYLTVEDVEKLAEAFAKVAAAHKARE